MQAVAHNPGFAAKTGIPQKVGREFVNADKKLGDTFAKPDIPKRMKQAPRPKDRMG